MSFRDFEPPDGQAHLPVSAAAEARREKPAMSVESQTVDAVLAASCRVWQDEDALGAEALVKPALAGQAPDRGLDEPLFPRVAGQVDPAVGWADDGERLAVEIPPAGEEDGPFRAVAGKTVSRACSCLTRSPS